MTKEEKKKVKKEKKEKAAEAEPEAETPKKEKKEKKKEKAAAEPEPAEEKKEKKAKKAKKAAAEAEQEAEASPKKEKKEKKEKKRKVEEAAEAEVEVETPKKDKKSKKAKKEEAAAEPAEDAEEEEEPAMKVHSKGSGGGGGAAPANPTGTCEVFMGNLSWQIDEASLQEAMKDCGTITNCKWLEDRDTGKFKGCGFISFETPEAAAKAVAMNGQDVLGRPIKCDFSQGRKPGAGGGGGGGGAPREMQPKPEGCTTVFCGNLSYDIDDDKIKAFFADCGEVSSVRWLTDKTTQEFKGCGFVEFSDPATALDKAAKLNGTDCLGRSIRIDYAAPRAPKW